MRIRRRWRKPNGWKIRLYDSGAEKETSERNFDVTLEGKMAAYVLVDLEVFDPEKFKAYGQMVPATIAQYGGRYIARGGKTEVVEGTWSPKRLVIVEFPSMEKARAWLDSPEYAAPKALRQASARSQMIVIEGI